MCNILVNMSLPDGSEVYVNIVALFSLMKES